MATTAETATVLTDAVLTTGTKLLKDCSIYATTNGVTHLALNGNVREVQRMARALVTSAARGYERAVVRCGKNLAVHVLEGVHGAVRSTVGPSLVYGCTMNVARAAGVPSLLAVGGANMATPVLVSKLGGPLGLMSAPSVAARSFPIAAHCAIEWGLYTKLQEFQKTNELGKGLQQMDPRARAVVEGVVCGGISAAVTALALSPYYGGSLLYRAAQATCPTAASQLGTAALRVTKIRTATSLQQGMVWFSTYEGLRLAINQEEQQKQQAEGENNEGAGTPVRGDAVAGALATTPATPVRSVAKLNGSISRSAPAKLSMRRRRQIASPRFKAVPAQNLYSKFGAAM